MDSPHDLLIVFVHTTIIYTTLMFMLRVLNRRAIGQLNVIDLLIVILLGSSVETAMVNADTHLTAGLVCAGTLLLLNFGLGRLMLRSKRLRHLVTGGPILLIHDGEFVEEHLRRIGLTKSDVMQELREREYSSIEQIRFAVLETDGAINVVPMQTHIYHSDRVPGTRPQTS